MNDKKWKFISKRASKQYFLIWIPFCLFVYFSVGYCYDFGLGFLSALMIVLTGFLRLSIKQYTEYIDPSLEYD